MALHEEEHNATETETHTEPPTGTLAVSLQLMSISTAPRRDRRQRGELTLRDAQISSGMANQLLFQAAFAGAGAYRVHVHAHANSSVSLRWADSVATWPFPALPEDPRITVVSRTANCKSAAAVLRPYAPRTAPLTNAMLMLTGAVLVAMKLSWNPSSTAGVSYHVIVHEIEANAAGGDVHDHAHSTAAVASACSARTEAAEGHAALLANTTETSVTITGLKNMEYAITVLVDLAGSSLCTWQACVLPGSALTDPSGLCAALAPVVAEPVEAEAHAENAWAYSMISVTIVCLAAFSGCVLFIMPEHWADPMVSEEACTPLTTPRALCRRTTSWAWLLAPSSARRSFTSFPRRPSWPTRSR
jgi:hypothetical protein